MFTTLPHTSYPTLAQAYATTGGMVLLVAMLCALNITIGFILQRAARRPLLPVSWLLAFATTGAMAITSAGEPAGFRMLAIVFVLLYGMKAVVGTASALKEKRSLPPSRWMMFAVLWPGMRPTVFLRALRQSPHVWDFASWGMVHLLTGVGFALAARWLWSFSGNALYSPAGGAAWLCMMIAASLVLHFGIFNLLAALWQSRGIDATPLFRAPLKSRTLAEFWSRRWNLAFSEMTALLVYQPVARRWGRTSGTMASFVFSGFLHELAISLPVGRGYGLPTLYFVFQGVAVLVTEYFRLTGLPARVLAVACIALPFPIMFHRWFLAETVVPLLQ